MSPAMGRSDNVEPCGDVLWNALLPLASANKAYSVKYAVWPDLLGSATPIGCCVSGSK
jgi:hypothetical protein